MEVIYGIFLWLKITETLKNPNVHDPKENGNVNAFYDLHIVRILANVEKNCNHYIVFALENNNHVQKNNDKEKEQNNIKNQKNTNKENNYPIKDDHLFF